MLAPEAMSSTEPAIPPVPGARLRWWMVVVLLFLLLITPGPAGSPFSGLPLSAQGQAAFIAALILVVFSVCFPPNRRVHVALMMAMAGLVVAKSLLSLNPVEPGWRGTYRTFGGLNPEWIDARFQGKSLSIDGDRVDQRLSFAGISWALHFVNDYRAIQEVSSGPRDDHRPLRVRWVGFANLQSPQAFDVMVMATGTVTVRVDDGAPVVFNNPSSERVRKELNAGPHRFEVSYDKPRLTTPQLIVSDPAFLITASPASVNEISAWRWRGRAAFFAGGLAFLCFVGALVNAYSPISRYLLSDLWLTPGRLAATLFFAFFALSGLQRSIPERGMTVSLGSTDDWIAYEAQARQIVFNGLLMTGDDGTGKPYYHYPLYSYVLAVAHLIFGEDFATVKLLNYLCLGAVGLVTLSFLTPYLTSNALVVALLTTGWFLWVYHAPYAATAYTDNLYLLVIMIVMLVAVRGLERESRAGIALTGIWSALAAATRPSFLLFPPFFVAALATTSQLGNLQQRFRHVVGYCLGFAAGIAPFTLRNWIVAGRFVLIVESFVMLPYFLFRIGDPAVEKLSRGGFGTSLSEFIDVWRTRPIETAHIELDKILFTLGYMDVGPLGFKGMPRALLVWPVLFALTLWLNRMPRAPRLVLLTFAASHLAAMVVGAPWTYGYKTILPFHLAMLVGTSFLLPHWGRQWWRTRIDLPRRLTGGPRTVSVVLPTYNEKDSIRGVIEDFFATGIVSEVLVINNNAVAGTSEEVAGTGAREIFETRQGYGAAIRRGLVEARGDLICICEPDGTFLARDVTKLVAFADDFDVVYGSRTSQQFIWQGANMGVFLRWGNWAVAKYMQFLYNATSLTDVGCTMRLIRREVAERLRDRFTIDGSQFGPEMMVLSLKEHFHVIQVPVNYLPRVGESAVTGDPAKAFWLGIQMIWLITRHRFEGSRKDLWTSRAGEASTARERLS